MLLGHRHTPMTAAARAAELKEFRGGAPRCFTTEPHPYHSLLVPTMTQIVKQLAQWCTANRWWGKNEARLEFSPDARKPEVSGLLLSYHPDPSASVERP